VTPLTSFLPYVLPYVMGCSEPLALQAVRDTCIRFAEQTLLLQATLDPVMAIPGIRTYDLDADPGAAIHLITQAWFEGDRLRVLYADDPLLPVEMFNDTFPGADKEPGRPSALLQNDDYTFTLDRAPDERIRGAITIRGVVKPTITATTVPDLLFKDYAFEIGQGAVAYLMNIPAQAFSAPAQADKYEAKYLGAQHQARVRANKSLGRGNLQVKLRRF
jgi:hypothetical protein